MVAVSILIFLVILGVLVTVHEFGHFIAARAAGIRVLEFAIGMGPKIWKKQKGETLYSVRAFPIGGFCNMAEDEEVDEADTHAFQNAKRRWRALALAAGSLMNFLLGFLLVLLINLPNPPGGFYSTPVVSALHEDFAFAGETGFLPGDRIVAINGHHIFVYDDISLFLALGEGKPYDFTLRRGGDAVQLRDVPLARTIPSDDGRMLYGFFFSRQAPTLSAKLQNAWNGSLNYVRLVWFSLGQLVSGQAGLSDMMGPIGMGSMVNDIVQAENIPVSRKTTSLLDMAALLAVNLAVVNLLPLPALDGGRLLFLAIEGIRKKRISQKYESLIHAVGFALLILLMLVIAFNDTVHHVLGIGR